jgi:hypothetical protein
MESHGRRALEVCAFAAAEGASTMLRAVAGAALAQLLLPPDAAGFADWMEARGLVHSLAALDGEAEASGAALEALARQWRGKVLLRQPPSAPRPRACPQPLPAARLLAVAAVHDPAGACRALLEDVPATLALLDDPAQARPLLLALLECARDRALLAAAPAHAVAALDDAVARRLADPALRGPALVYMTRRHQLPPAAEDVRALAGCVRDLAAACWAFARSAAAGGRGGGLGPQGPWLERALGLLVAKAEAQPDAEVVAALCPHACSSAQPLSDLERLAAPPDAAGGGDVAGLVHRLGDLRFQVGLGGGRGL